MDTFLIILGSIVAVLLLAWWVYRKIRESLCCGTCGCNLISEKRKLVLLAKREKKELRKNKNCAASCPLKK